MAIRTLTVERIDESMKYFAHIMPCACEDDLTIGGRGYGWPPAPIGERNSKSIDTDNAWGVQEGRVYTDDEERQLRALQDERKAAKRLPNVATTMGDV